MTYLTGDIVTIRKNLTEDELQSVELAWANREAPLGGLKCNIRSYIGDNGHYESIELYYVTVMSDGRWNDYTWQVPEDWFHEPCMFGGIACTE